MTDEGTPGITREEYERNAQRAAAIRRRFAYQKPGPATIPIHEWLRDLYAQLAVRVSELGESREASLAMTHLEESLMWANAHVARNLDPETGTPR